MDGIPYRQDKFVMWSVATTVRVSSKVMIKMGVDNKLKIWEGNLEGLASNYCFIFRIFRSELHTDTSLPQFILHFYLSLNQ